MESVPPQKEYCERKELTELDPGVRRAEARRHTARGRVATRTKEVGEGRDPFKRPSSPCEVLGGDDGAGLEEDAPAASGALHGLVQSAADLCTMRGERGRERR